MRQEKKTILELLKTLFRKSSPEETEMPVTPSEATVENLVNRVMGDEAEKPSPAATTDSDKISEKGEEEAPEKEETVKDEKKKESCPYATRRAIVESIEEIRRFAEEHKLAATVLRSLLSLLGEIALGALKGKVSRQILEVLLRAINYEFAVEEAFRKGHDNGRNELIEERYPAADDGLPHINGTIHRADGTSIFDVAAEARN